jgi:sialic acid synthase SpsE
MIEKHLTLDKTLPGPDQATSADPSELAALIASIREVETALGSGVKEPSQAERANILPMRRSIVAARALPAGTALTRDALTLKRPAGGIPPRDLDRVLGRVTRVALAADQPLEWPLLSDD